jgi:hypothetical protein
MCGYAQENLSPVDWAHRKNHSDVMPVLAHRPDDVMRTISSEGGPGPRKVSISSLESGVESEISASASSFAAAATSAVRPTSLSISGNAFVHPSGGQYGLDDGLFKPQSGPQSDSPWGKLAFFGNRRSSMTYAPRHVEGYMSKRGGLVKNWKLRYCVLSMNKLSYFGKQVRGRTALLCIVAVIPLRVLPYPG